MTEMRNLLKIMEGAQSQVAEGERHGNSKIYDKCWDGYEKVPGKSRGEKGSCRKKTAKEGVKENKTLREFMMNTGVISAPQAAQPTETEDLNISYNKTQQIGDNSVTVSANAKSMEELDELLMLAGIARVGDCGCE